jgi:hypothetical protein
VRHEAMLCIHCESVDWHRGVVVGSSLRIDWSLSTFRYIAVPSSAGSSSPWTANTTGNAVGRLFQLERFSCWTKNDTKA